MKLGRCLIITGYDITIVGDDYKSQTPKFELEAFFDGNVKALGIVQYRSGEIVQRFRVCIDGSTYPVNFDDWFWALDDNTMMNRSYIKKSGIVMAEVTIFMQKQDLLNVDE